MLPLTLEAHLQVDAPSDWICNKPLESQAACFCKLIGKGMSTKTALIVIGRYKDEWNKLNPTQQADFVERVGRTAAAIGLTPITGYRLTATPGAFIEIWEANSIDSIDRVVKNFEAIGYTRYVDARWMLGEREQLEPVTK